MQNTGAINKSENKIKKKTNRLQLKVGGSQA